MRPLRRQSISLHTVKVSPSSMMRGGGGPLGVKPVHGKPLASPWRRDSAQGGVDSAHSRWESQPDGCGADDLTDGKGPHVSGCKLTCPPSDGNVLSREPHVLSNPVDGRRPPPPISLLLHPLGRPHQVCVCGPPGLLALPDEGCCRRDSHLLLLARKQRGLVPETALKRGQSRGC